MSNAKSFVDSAIKQYKASLSSIWLVDLYLQVAVFSKTYCPYCKKAKAALESFKLKDDALGWIEIDDHPNMDAIQDYLKELTGAR